MSAWADLLKPGTFLVGCNYWASHAGTAMWSDWRPDVVEQDLDTLAPLGLQVLRVFPLWPDFQPITQLHTYHGLLREVRRGEEALGDDEAGRDGVSEEMLERFAAFASLAERRGLKLIVGLMSGWMSGRLFVPPALQGRNVLTDPVAIQWQVRFVKHFVRRFRDCRAILAWDLGNECNCMGTVPSREAAYVWTATIADAIRSSDPARPVLSGMHGLSPQRDAPWTIQDQAELTDVLTTHPYPLFTPHCAQDPLNTMRPGLHATAESRLYADVGGRPCLVEEIGSLGPMIASDEAAASYARTSLFSLWAHDCLGFLWWCAFDQAHLGHAPYDWHAIERELGLFRADRTAKRVAHELRAFREFLDTLPFKRLPERLTEAVCIVTEGQDAWGVAYSSFILAKQAGFDLRFQHASQALKRSRLYLLPNVGSLDAISRRRWLELLRRVGEGATLYVSLDDGVLSPFSEVFGVEVVTRSMRAGPTGVTLDGLAERPAFTLSGRVRLELRPTRAEVLGQEADGNPVFTRSSYGKGVVYLLTLPLEMQLATTPGVFHGQQAEPFWRLLAHVAEPFVAGRALKVHPPQMGVTEHPLDEDHRVAVLINYSPQTVEVPLDLSIGWQVERTLRNRTVSSGAPLAVRIDGNDAAVLTMRRG